MSRILIRHVAFFAFCAVLMPLSTRAQSLPIDTPLTVNGVEAVCTGIGLDARADPRWKSFSLKIEVAGPGGSYLADERVTVSAANNPLLTVTCSAPWLLFRLPPGRYQVEAAIGSETVRSAAFVPVEGQGRIILRFGAPESIPAP